MSLVEDADNIRLGMAGMVVQNGHPYSWAAIINGYEPDAMAECGIDAIPAYLAKQPAEAFGIEGVRVSHIWCDDRKQAEHVAKASRIEHVVEAAADLIGKVDAVLIPTDIGGEHLERARPFIEAGVAVFIDKPLTDRADHLAQFCAWAGQGSAIMSSSCMRYSSGFAQVRSRLEEVGQPRLITMSMCKNWPRYGIHALEAVYPMLRAGGYTQVRALPMPADEGRSSDMLVQIGHDSGCEVLIAMIDDLLGSMGVMHVYGTKGHLTASFDDSFDAFKAQLAGFVSYLCTGQRPFPFSETVELMTMVLAGIESREQGGRVVSLEQIAGRLR